MVAGGVATGAAPGRAFLALRPDDAVCAQLAALALPAGARRVDPRDLHLTLAFLGDLKGTSPQQLLTELAAVARGPVEVTLTALEYWPGPRVACAVGTSASAEVLSAALWAALAPRGYAGPDKPLRPHVTLARGLPREPAGAVPLPQPLTFRASELRLLARAGAGQVPRYQELGALPLGL